MKEKGKSKASARLIWLTGLAAALAVHAIGLLLFQLSDDESAAPEVDYLFASLPSIHWQEAQGDLLREQAYLFDSAPLFLPTRWNSASSPVVEALEKRPAELFSSFPARLSYGESDFGLAAMAKVEPEPPLQSLKSFTDKTHTVFGRGEVDQPELAARFATIEVLDPARGEVVMRSSVSTEGAPAVKNRLWSPVEFLMQVESVGRVGEPVLLQGSGVEEVDQFLRASLHALANGQMLEPGYYRISAGP